MRLRFGDARATERRELLARIAEARSRLSRLVPEEATLLVGDAGARAALESAMGRELRRVHPDLRAEVHAVGAGLAAVVSPASDDGLGPLVLEVVQRLGPMGALRLERHLPAIPELEAVLDVRARTSVDLGAARVRLGFSRGHLLEAVVYCPSFSSAADERLLDAADLLVRRLVGDALFDDWFGSVEVAPLPRGGILRVISDGAVSPEDTLGLGDVLAATERAAEGAMANLPEIPCHRFCERAEWTLFELEPEQHEDPPRLSDVALFSTMLPEAAKCLLEGGRFSSARFSRHGESMAYVKVDARDASPEARLELRATIEDALNWSLVPGGFGCVVGAGVGLRYVYALLALTSVERGVFIARQTLRRLNVDRRSWILFCDAEMSHEWAEIWDGAPPPP